MIVCRTRVGFAVLLAVVAVCRAKSFDGYDAAVIEKALEGRKIVVPTGCPEEPRLDEGIAHVFAKNFPGITDEDSMFRARITAAFRAGLAKTAGGRIEFDSASCRTGSKSKLVADEEGHSAMVDGGHLVGSKAHLALGFLLYESPAAWEKYVANPNTPPTGTSTESVGARVSFGVYDPQERLLVYYGTEKATAADDYLVLRVIGPEHWEKAAFALGSKIGKILAKLPGK